MGVETGESIGVWFTILIEIKIHMPDAIALNTLAKGVTEILYFDINSSQKKSMSSVLNSWSNKIILLFQKQRFTFIQDSKIFVWREIMLVDETPCKEGLTMEGVYFYGNSINIKITNKKKV